VSSTRARVTLLSKAGGTCRLVTWGASAPEHYVCHYEPPRGHPY
jgi:hypothetical protein